MHGKANGLHNRISTVQQEMTKLIVGQSLGEKGDSSKEMKRTGKRQIFF